MDDRALRNDADLYETDFFGWTQRQAETLRSGRLAALDVGNVLEEIESLGRAQIHALRSRYAVLSLHLLKLVLQPERRGRSWALTIVEQRIQIARLLAASPGLKPKRNALFREGYEDGRKLCLAETGLDDDAVPREPPFTLEQVEDEGWLPASL